MTEQELVSEQLLRCDQANKCGNMMCYHIDKHEKTMQCNRNDLCKKDHKCDPIYSKD